MTVRELIAALLEVAASLDQEVVVDVDAFPIDAVAVVKDSSFVHVVTGDI